MQDCQRGCVWAKHNEEVHTVWDEVVSWIPTKRTPSNKTNNFKSISSVLGVGTQPHGSRIKETVMGRRTLTSYISVEHAEHNIGSCWTRAVMGRRTLTSYISVERAEHNIGSCSTRGDA